VLSGSHILTLQVKLELTFQHFTNSINIAVQSVWYWRAYLGRSICRHL